MTEFYIQDEDLVSLAGQVVIVTGCSSGIGLATVQLLLELKAKVVGGDITPSPTEHANFSYVKTDTASWSDLLTLFEHAWSLHHRVDHVFSNAGISGRMDYLTESFDAEGKLQEPNHLVLDVNLRGMINTSYLGLVYIRRSRGHGSDTSAASTNGIKNSNSSGSIVCTASASSFQRFRVADYTTAKHGVLGWMRGMVPNLEAQGLASVVRVNSVAPSWTRTGIVTDAIQRHLSAQWQGPEVVARSVALLMADEKRMGQLIYSWAGRFAELEQVFLPVAQSTVGGQDEDGTLAKVVEALGREAAGEEGKVV